MKMLLCVRGKTSKWNFIVDVDPKYLADYLSDGLDLNTYVCTVAWWERKMGDVMQKVENILLKGIFGNAWEETEE